MYIALSSTLELVVILLLLWGFWKEDKVIAFENKVVTKFKTLKSFFKKGRMSK